MTIEDRLRALRDAYPTERARMARIGLHKDTALFWTMNALAFDWHRNPPWYAVSSFKYAERLRRSV